MEETENRLAILRGKHKAALYAAEYRLVYRAMAAHGFSVRKAATALGAPSSSVQSCIESNPKLARAISERRDVAKEER